jgi:hypothetical protein
MGPIRRFTQLVTLRTPNQYYLPRYLLDQQKRALAITEDEGLFAATDLACNHAVLSIQPYLGADHFNLVIWSEAQFLTCHDPHRSQVHLKHSVLGLQHEVTGQLTFAYRAVELLYFLHAASHHYLVGGVVECSPLSRDRAIEVDTHDQQQDDKNHYGENHSIQQAGYFRWRLLSSRTLARLIALWQKSQ